MHGRSLSVVPHSLLDWQTLQKQPHHMATCTGVCVSVCARACAMWCSCFAHSRLHSFYLPCLPRAHRPAHAGSRIAAKAVPSGLSPWTPCDNTVATKEEKLRGKPPIERRAGEHREKRATCRRPATKSPFKRKFCEVNVDRATTTANGKHMRRKTADNERSSQTSAQTTPTQKNDHYACQREQRPSRHRHTSLGVAPPICSTYP